MAFSLTRSALRAASHVSRVTIFGLAIVLIVMIVSPLLAGSNQRNGPVPLFVFF